MDLQSFYEVHILTDESLYVEHIYKYFRINTMPKISDETSDGRYFRKAQFILGVHCV